MIPILDLTEQYRSLKNELDSAVLDVLAYGKFINGPNVQAFEAEFAEYVGVPFAIGVNSGTDALHLALRALDIGPGDEVITTPFSFVATTEAIGIVGATPVFVDIDERTYNLNPRALEAAITPRTKVVLPVHLYGAPAAMPEMASIAERYGLYIVEDCAQAIGSTVEGRMVGSLGSFGCFSFFPSKNLGACGDGGMITTSSPQWAKRLRALRAHGGTIKYNHEELGLNSRLDEIQAAILRVKLRHLEGWITARRAIAQHYNSLLGDTSGIVTPIEESVNRNVFHQYTVRVSERDAIRSQLTEAGVETMVYYPIPLHLQPVHAALAYRRGAFPRAEAAAREVLSLPIYPELSISAVDRVAGALSAAVVDAVPAIALR
jgi:dTDP-4-amino-4,6-dideoxygalactose transaminase